MNNIDHISKLEKKLKILVAQHVKTSTLLDSIEEKIEDVEREINGARKPFKTPVYFILLAILSLIAILLY